MARRPRWYATKLFPSGSQVGTQKQQANLQLFAGTCQGCQKGLFQMCAAPVINGETKEGGYAEYVRIQAKAAVRVPDHVDAAQYAPVLCAGVTAFNAIRNMNIPVGETIAIKGLGGVGHMAIQYANRLGYRVVAMSRDGSKEKLARELGAHDYVDGSKGDEAEQLQKLGGARLIIVTSPTADAAGPLLGGLGVLGKLLFLSVPGEITVNTFHMVSTPFFLLCMLSRAANVDFRYHSLEKVFQSSAGPVVTTVTLRTQSPSQNATTLSARSRSTRCLKPSRHTVRYLRCTQAKPIAILTFL